MNNLAMTLVAQSDYVCARRLQEYVLETSKRVLGEEHPDPRTSMNNLASTLWTLGDRAEALRLIRQCLAGRREVLGEDHPDTAVTAKILNKLEEQSVAEPADRRPRDL